MGRRRLVERRLGGSRGMGFADFAVEAFRRVGGHARRGDRIRKPARQLLLHPISFRYLSMGQMAWPAWLSQRRDQNNPASVTKTMTPQITYRGMPHSPVMDAKILELAAKLEELHP